MIYLEKEDLIARSFERFIDESSGDVPGDGESIEDVRERILDQTELKNIKLVSSYLGTRYDVEAIFDEEDPIRSELIVDILVRLCLFDIVRRNAPRKVPEDYKEEYEKAIELLQKIATGRIPVDGLPPATDGEGNPVSDAIWGNIKNERFYI